MADQDGIPDGKHWCQMDVRLPGSWRDGDVQDCRRCYLPPVTMPRSVMPRSVVEYAWRQPDGVVAPVLPTEGYELMVWVVCDWVPVLDLVKLALKPGQFTDGSVPAAGDQLDAERRGDVYDPCRGCIHEAHELPCLAVIDAARAQRCGCHTRKSESLKEI